MTEPVSRGASVVKISTFLLNQMEAVSHQLYFKFHPVTTTPFKSQVSLLADTNDQALFQGACFYFPRWAFG